MSILSPLFKRSAESAAELTLDTRTDSSDPCGRSGAGVPLTPSCNRSRLQQELPRQWDTAKVELDSMQPDGPTVSVRLELEAFLSQDATRLGQTYRHLKAGLSDEEIMEDFGTQTTGIVWHMRRMLKVLFDANLPTGPSVVLATERKLRAMLSTGEWSAEAREYLGDLLASLETQAHNVEARVREDEAAERQTAAVEAQAQAGIYVYSLPHYIRYPYDPGSGRTLMKVGHSGNSAILRFREQTRTTALPEEPILLRVYPTGDETPSGEHERTFHALLDAAEHSRQVTRTAGREWFVTSLRFLDEIAGALGLSVRIVNDAETIDEE